MTTSSIQSSLKVLLLILSCAVNAAYADSKEYASIVAQYALEKDDIFGHSEGRIDGEYFLALTANRLSPKEGINPSIYFLTINKGKPRLVTKIDLQGDYVSAYSVNITNNSIYLEHSVGHHGWHGGRYQFKKINQKFKLIGFNSQSFALGCYAGDDASPSCNTYEVWSGNSHNLLTSNTVCWKEKLVTRQQNKMAWDRYEKWLQPQKGMRYQLKVSQIDLPLLDGFDLSKSLPGSCYFDSKNRLVKK